MPEVTTPTNTTVSAKTQEIYSETTAVSTANTEISEIMEESSITEETAMQTDIISSTQTAVSEENVTELETSAVTAQTTTVTTVTDELTENTSEITVSSVIETEYETEMTTAVADAYPAETAQSNILNGDVVSNLKLGAIAALIIAAAAYFTISSKKSKAKANGRNARQRDAERLSKNKEKKKKTAKAPAEAKAKPKNKSVLETLPYIKVMPNDIWLIANNTYSKAYCFSDINYNIGDIPQQLDILQNYSAYLNTLDDTVDCQVCCWNCGINLADFERDVLIDEADDDFEKYRQEYNSRVLKESLNKGTNSIQKKLYLTLTIKTNDSQYAVQKFKSLDLELRNSYDPIGSTHLHPMTSQQRVEMLKDFFVGNDVTIPTFTENDYKNKLEKIYCAPDYFEFKSDYFMFNDKYAKCVFIKDYPSKAADSIITDLMDTNLEIMVTTNIIAHDPAKARKLVQRQITAIDTNMAQRESKAAQHGNFSSQIPVRIKNQRDGYSKLYDKLTIDDQKLFSVNTIIMITADSFEKLQNCEDVVASTLKRQGCMFGQMKYQQEDGMIDCLPVGSQRKFEFRRTMPTESVAIFQPFNVKEVTQRNTVYYGLNVLSNNLIAFDRLRSLMNPSGFILGCPGSGKSFTAKREMMDVFLRYPDADIMIIDPEREYPAVVDMFGGESVRISLGSQNFINPFEFDEALLDDKEVNVISDKSQLITSFISCMDKNPLNAQEVSFIDRCVRTTYERSKYWETHDKNDMPTLGDFYKVMEEETDVDEAMQKKLLMTIEMYVKGSAKYFNNKTNVNVDNRVISYDIKDLSGTMKTQSMLLVLDYIWNRLSANREKGRSTWIYIDEVYLLFANEYCLSFLQALYKRARKYGGVVTGITQNVEDLLKDTSSRTMLSNSEFLILLKQAPADIIQLKETLKFNDSEIKFVSNVKSGQGLLVLGGTDKIPFYDEFPKDTELYKRINTSFAETAALKKAKTS